MEAGGFGATSMAALADNKSVLATTSKGIVAVIDVTTGKKVRDLEIERGPQSSAPPIISPDGKTAAILFGGGYGSNQTGKVVLVDLDSGKSKKTLEWHFWQPERRGLFRPMASCSSPVRKIPRHWCGIYRSEMDNSRQKVRNANGRTRRGERGNGVVRIECQTSLIGRCAGPPDRASLNSLRTTGD